LPAKEDSTQASPRALATPQGATEICIEKISFHHVT